MKPKKNVPARNTISFKIRTRPLQLTVFHMHTGLKPEPPIEVLTVRWSLEAET
jgi:hypothetical protein